MTQAEPASPALAAAITARFADIAATRMAGIPVVNPALGVALQGWQRTGDMLAGVLVTPWFMNFIAFAAGDAPQPANRVGDKTMLALPAGAFEAIRAHDEVLGGYWTVSLFSPMFEFADMETACATADAALAEMLTAPEPVAPPPPSLPPQVKRPVSRRDLFRLGDAAPAGAAR